MRNWEHLTKNAMNDYLHQPVRAVLPAESGGGRGQDRTRAEIEEEQPMDHRVVPTENRLPEVECDDLTRLFEVNYQPTDVYGGSNDPTHRARRSERGEAAGKRKAAMRLL